MKTYPRAGKNASNLLSLQFYCKRFRLSVYTYSPGDGVTRYKFVENHFEPKDQSYFGPKSGCHVSLGIKEAWQYANGRSDQYSQAPTIENQDGLNDCGRFYSKNDSTKRA